jgi:RHS repeat-associated protein
MGGHSYAYDGLNNRISQTVSSVVTKYLLDVQPGLTKVIGATTSGNTDRYIHSPRGIHAMEDNSGVWTHPAQDGLGSVRMELSDNLTVNGMQILSPFGVVESSQGTIGIPFGFTGEQTDGNGLSYLRARYYNPETGVFTALDPMELLNRYAYVNGNPIRFSDPSGLISTCGDQDAICEAQCWEQWRATPSDIAESVMNSCFEACIQEAPPCSDCSWADRDSLHELVPFMREVARRWNRVDLPPNYISNILNGGCDFEKLVHLTHDTGFSDEGFVALIIVNLHIEGRLRRRNKLGNNIGNTIMRGLIDWFGDQLHVWLGKDSSIGIGNVRPSVARQIFEGIIDTNNPDQVYDPPFWVGNRLDHISERYIDIINTPHWYEDQLARPIFNLLSEDEVSIELLAANFNRGIIRAKDLGVVPTVFNLSAWHNRGVQNVEQYTANSAQGRDLNHANSAVRDMVEVVLGPCDFGLRLTRSTSLAAWDFTLFNEQDALFLNEESQQALDKYSIQ